MTSNSDYTSFGNRIVVFNRAIPNPEHLINLAEDTSWSKNYNDQYGDDVARRYETSVPLSRENPEDLVVLESLNSSLKSYAEYIGSERFKDRNPIPPTFTAYISKYIIGGRIRPHTDEDYLEDNGIYTFIAYLNDEYEGGEVGFSDYDLEIKLKAGDLLVFPSYYKHYGSALISGYKYIAISRAEMY